MITRIYNSIGFRQLNRKYIRLVQPATFYWSACSKPGMWALMYLCVRGVGLPLSVIILVDFGTVSTECFFAIHFTCK
jgi:hypothetical protein